MSDNFFKSMLSEDGKISHKRWISVSIAGVLAWAIIYAVVNALNDAGRYNILIATMVFILIMAGVATIPQIMSIWKGGAAPKEDEQKNG